MFDLSIRIVVIMIIALAVLFLIWLGAFFVHIVRDEKAMEDKQKYSPKLVDIVVNNILSAGFILISKIQKSFRRS
jgi:hypothetical protein